MEEKELLEKIYSFLDDANTRANEKFRENKEARDIVHDIFFEIDNFFINLEIECGIKWKEENKGDKDGK
jgi:hypothetical protein